MNTAFIIAPMIAGFVAIIAMFLLFGRLRRLPDPGPNSPTPSQRISIIIPARNEESNLGVLLSSIDSQSFPPLETIVVDDHSDDRTAEIAGSHHCRVIRSQDLPQGWFGKPWACQQGADAAEGEVLLFLDADVQLAASALARLATCSHLAPRAVISVCPWHRIENAYEELSIFFNLLMVGGIGAFTFRGYHTSGIGLFGQTMWIPKTIYREIGGHASVRKTVLENFHLAGVLESRGIERICFIGKDSITMRMFRGGLGELMSGWAKGFRSGAGLTSTLAMTLSIFWLVGLMALAIIILMLPIAGTDSFIWAISAYFTVASILALLFRKIGSFSCLNAIFFPISLFFYQGLFAHTLLLKRRGGTTRWKGRDVA